MAKFHFRLLCLFLAFMRASSEDRCQFGWALFHQSCYIFKSSPANWSSALISCRELGGDLVEITSARENAFLVDNDFASRWIGLNDRSSEGTYIWVPSGKVANFTNWASNKTNESSYVEDCIMMGSDGRWNESDCGTGISYICEQPSVRHRCLLSTCRHGGTCIEKKNDIFCVCHPPFFGRYCERQRDSARDEASANLNYCFPDPCLNGGTCSEDVEDNYKCSCSPAFFGRNCEEFSRCVPNPCLHGGTCVDGEFDYTCNCPHDVTGVNCNETCPAEWSRFDRSCYRFRSKEENWFMARYICQHSGGNLVEINNARENEFLVGLREVYLRDSEEVMRLHAMHENDTWIGLNGQTNTSAWTSSRNVASFTNWTIGGKSYCVEMGKTGKWNQIDCKNKRSYFCERSFVELQCFEGACQNGGTCTDLENNYTCSCQPEFHGRNCEKFNSCFHMPCRNGGTCMDLYNTYHCICKQGFMGSNCIETCPSGWTYYGGSCYSYSASPANWFSAEASCRNGGGDLIEINSLSDNFLPAFRDGPSVERAWIGLYDQGNNTHIWVLSGNVAGFSNWARGQPGNVAAGEYCVEIWYDGRWNELNCSSERPYYCERPVIKVVDYLPNPCLNGGTCIGGFGIADNCTCVCLPEFFGRFCEETCLIGLSNHGKTCYGLSTSTASWSSARTSCSNDGRNLVAINSAPENAFLVDLMAKYNVSSAWIGLRIEDDEDTHSWVLSGHAANFTNWSVGEPNGVFSDEKCVEIWKAGMWNDLNCKRKRNYVCERFELRYCIPDPCLNGGTCIEAENDYTCYCRPAFFGRNCEKFNSCFSNPCQNGGTCVDGDNVYNCYCADGFTGVHCNKRCPAGWTKFEERCYSFNATSLSWRSARTSCNTMRGNLVEISSDAQNDFLVRLRDHYSGGNAWIGLKKAAHKATYAWDRSGNTAKFKNWAPGQPGRNDRCVEMWGSGLWNDLKCTSNRSYFCERSVIDAN